MSGELEDFPLWKGRARVTDPGTSKEAAAHVKASGAAARIRTLALEAVGRYPGHTSSELARIYGFSDPRVLGRRLSELDRKGLVVRAEPRKCKVSGRSAATWRSL